MGNGNGNGTVYISRDELKEIVEKALGMKFPSDAEVIIGGPIMDYAEGELHIGFAWDSTDCSPIEWATGKPDWLGDGK